MLFVLTFYVKTFVLEIYVKTHNSLTVNQISLYLNAIGNENISTWNYEIQSNGHYLIKIVSNDENKILKFKSNLEQFQPRFPHYSYNALVCESKNYNDCFFYENLNNSIKSLIDDQVNISSIKVVRSSIISPQYDILRNVLSLIFFLLFVVFTYLSLRMVETKGVG